LPRLRLNLIFNSQWAPRFAIAGGASLGFARALRAGSQPLIQPNQEEASLGQLPPKPKNTAASGFESDGLCVSDERRYSQ